jgi:glycosyltransferase involved in cell wall biosynthesis
MTLTLITSLRVKVGPNGAVTLTRKFIDGIMEYKRHWDGPVTAVMEPSQTPTGNLDDVEVDAEKLPFTILAASFDDPGLGKLLSGTKLVVGSLSALAYHHNRVGTLCRSLGIPIVCVAEYTLKTRCQIVLAESRNPAKRARRIWWVWNEERRYQELVKAASGIQCNGTPTFEAYRSMNARPLLYFDTRTTEEMLATTEEIERRTDHLLRGGPIRLLFSGRLALIKGADHLIHVALELRRLGVPFELTICGGGQLEQQIRRDVDRLGLGDCVKLTGIIDFKTELTPLTKERADIFVCCHRQGDPSCTYLEVMSCGVPIVGYDNEAFLGIVRHSGVGWLEPMNHPRQIARKIADLSAHRSTLVKASYQALEFARKHTFEKTFRARVAHFKACLPS